MRFKRSCVVVCAVFTLFSAATGLAEMSCKSPSGEDVAWWVLIKVPQSLDAYVYRDSKSDSCDASTSCWGEFRRNLNDLNGGPLSLTLQQIYSAPGVEYMMYNDDSPLEGGSILHSDFAHAKGVLAHANTVGFWMVHSVPRFPRSDLNAAYPGLPANAKMHAQSFICVSLKTKSIEVATQQLRLARPYVYQHRGFETWNAEEVSSQEPQFNLAHLQISDGSIITSFSKSRHWKRDFYDHFVASTLNTHLLVETWNRGRGTLRNACTARYQISNVTQIQLDAAVAWGNKQDHSKWAISAPRSEADLVCIGDINRQSGQRVRGGGALCLRDKSLWQAFFSMIKGSGCTKGEP